MKPEQKSALLADLDHIRKLLEADDLHGFVMMYSPKSSPRIGTHILGFNTMYEACGVMEMVKLNALGQLKSPARSDKESMN